MQVNQFRFNQKLLVPAIVVVIALAGGLYLFFTNQLPFTKSELPETREIVNKVEFAYPQDWDDQIITDVDRGAGIILRLGRKDPEATLLVRSIVGDLEENFNTKDLLDPTVEKMKAEIKDFELLNGKAEKLEDFEALKIEYKQKDAKGAIYQNLMIILPTQKQTFYLIFRSPESSFEKISGDIDSISKSFAGHIKSSPQ